MIDYFHDRRIWPLEGDDPVPQLKCQVNCGGADRSTLSQAPRDGLE